MSYTDPLLVPMVVEALVVNDAVRAPKNQIDTFLRTEMVYNAIQNANNGQPFLSNNDIYFTSSQAVPPHGVTPSNYYNGVYLKWRLPRAYTQGFQDGVTGVTSYRQVPNRWLIVRYSGPVSARQASAWILESDFLYPVNSPPQPYNISQGASMYVQPQSQTNQTPVGCRIGRNTALGSWTESGKTLNLTAMAPGNPAFAFYQPQCNNVFSFVDCLNGQDPETLSYLVAGWFSDLTNDPLSPGLATYQAARYNGVTSTVGFQPSTASQVNWAAGSITLADGSVYSIAAGNTGAMSLTSYIYLDPGVSTTVLQVTTDESQAQGGLKVLIATATPFFLANLADLGWTLPAGSDPSAIATWSLLSGQVDGIEWQNSSLPPGGTPSGTTPVSVAVGNTSIEALTAMITGQAQEMSASVEPQLLEAFQLNAMDVLDQPDGAAVLQEKLQASFFQKFGGGYSWTIVDAPDADSEVSPQELQKEQQWLATLVKNQQALDQAILNLAALQRQLYVMWWKFTSWPFAYQGSSAIACLDDQSNLQNQIDPSVAGSLAQLTNQQLNQVQSLMSLVPSGATPDELDQAIAQYAANQQLPAIRSLKRTAAPLFYEINNPVVLIAGAGASGIVPAPATLQCRFASQLITGFTFKGKTIGSGTSGLNLPQPNLGQVSGVPWNSALITSLLWEFFLLDSTNATMIAGAIGAAVSDVQSAMSDQKNDVGVYPSGGVQSWTANPWHPLLLYWQASYYPIQYGTPQAPNWTFYNGQYIWNTSQQSVVTPPMGLQGLIQLTPAAAMNMEARVQQFLNNNPNLPAAEKQAFTDLLQFVQTDDAWDLLSQALDGFNDQLQLGVSGVFMSPGASQFVTSPTTGALVGSAAEYPPGLPPIPMQGQKIPSSQFQPWRAGQWEFLNLVVVDEWGQAIWPFASQSGSFKTEHVYLPPEMTPVLTSNTVTLKVASGPAVSALTPAAAATGSSQFALTIDGVGFTAASTAQWNGAGLATTFVSATQLTAVVPAGLLATAGAANVTVATAGNTSPAIVFTIASGPFISSISPNLVQAGMAPSDFVSVTVTGAGFASGALVQWNGIPVGTTVVNSSALTAQVPASYFFGAGNASINVALGGNTSNAVTLTISPGAAISSIAPALAPVGSPSFVLTVTGTGFEPGSKVSVNNTAVATTFVSPSELQATVSGTMLTQAGELPVVESVGAKVLPNAPDPFIQLPPALLQPAQLNFNLISAASDNTVFGPLNPDADPICGWVLPNHLDGALTAYDSTGASLGEMALGIAVSGDQVVCWTPAPGSPYATLQQIAQAIPHFGEFLLTLSQQTPALFGHFLRAIDETLWTTMPAGAAFDTSLSVLIGRPLAMVRARLQFLLDGTPYLDPSWQYTFNGQNCSQVQAQTSAVTTYPFGIELGNLAQLDDGLIGYFVADNYGVFNVVAQSGASQDAYMNPIGANNNYIYMPFDGVTQTFVSMLVDPRAPVHATTGILPVVTASLPLSFTSAALARMNVTFRVNGILTDQQIPSDPKQPATILMPVPKEKTGNWTWVEFDENTWNTYPTAPNDTTARLSNVSPVLRRGLLQLSSGLTGGAKQGALPAIPKPRLAKRAPMANLIPAHKKDKP